MSRYNPIIRSALLSCLGRPFKEERANRATTKAALITAPLHNSPSNTSDGRAVICNKNKVCCYTRGCTHSKKHLQNDTCTIPAPNIGAFAGAKCIASPITEADEILNKEEG